jgi:hypothetical protein
VLGEGRGRGALDLTATGRKLNSICSSILLRNKRDERNFRPISFSSILSIFSNQKMIPDYYPPHFPPKMERRDPVIPLGLQNLLKTSSEKPELKNIMEKKRL